MIVSIPSVAREAVTISYVVLNCAGSICCTIARIHTLFIDTSQMIKTIFINQTFIWLTTLIFIVRVTFGILIAIAKCMVLFCLTIGIATTSCEKTRVLTFFIDAGLVI